MNIRERLGTTTPLRDPSMNSMPDRPKRSSDASQNSSSLPLKQPSVLLSIQELTKERDQIKQELMDKEEELQETRELNLTLFSQISELKQTVAQLTEKIESLNESDIQLAEARNLNATWQKEKKEILAQASKNKEAAEEAKEEASWARHEAANAERKAHERVSDREKRAKEKERELNKREELINEEIKAKVSIEFEKTRIIRNIPFYISLGYGFVTTILFAILSDTFRSEFWRFVVSIWNIISGTEIWLWNIAPDMHWTLRVLLCTLVTSFALFLVWRVISRLRDIFADFADITTLAFLLLFLAIAVFLSDYLSLLPINLILMYIISAALYMGCRAFVQWTDLDAKKDICSVLLILVCGVGVLWFILSYR